MTTITQPKRLLELFCGTKSVGKVYQSNGYDVVSLDYNKKFNATHTEDILTWDYTIYPPNHFDVIWSSPDCTTWSLASGGRYRKMDHIYGLNNEKQDSATLGNNMILRLIQILKYFKPKTWYMENPRGMLRHFPPLKDFVKEVNGHRTLVYYANYNDWGFLKATDIWSNIPLWEDETQPEMKEGTYIIKYREWDNRYKKFYLAFAKSPEERSRIPPDLINRLRLQIPNEV
jgi:site-specific DNA-cytosine methylase